MSMTLQQKIEAMQAHVARKPRDMAAHAKLRELKRRAGFMRALSPFDELLRKLYAVPLASHVAAHPMRDVPRPK